MKTDKSVEDQIRFLEEQLLKPEVRASPRELEIILADDFLEFGSSGRVYDKQQIIAALQQESGGEILLMDFQVKLIGPGAALATSRTVRFSGSENTPICFAQLKLEV